VAEGTREQEDPTRFFTQVQEIVERLRINILEPSLRGTVYGGATQDIRGLPGLRAKCTSTCLLVPTDHQWHMRLGLM
tara:strand:- start:531 stop:761 length:231 start_codon:yes stop_codon:yes gene_type:complete